MDNLPFENVLKSIVFIVGLPVYIVVGVVLVTTKMIVTTLCQFEVDDLVKVGLMILVTIVGVLGLTFLAYYTYMMIILVGGGI